MLEIRAFDAWLRKDYSVALDDAREAVELSKKIDVSLPSNPIHTLALIERDSGNVEAALVNLLEGMDLEEALEEKHGKNAEFFGNIGRCLQLRKEFETALRFYKRSGKEMAARPSDFHNSGWLRLWVGETLCKLNRVADGYVFLCAAKHIWSQSSKLLEISADQALNDLRGTHPELEDAMVPQWKAEKMFSAWVAQS